MNIQKLGIIYSAVGEALPKGMSASSTIASPKKSDSLEGSDTWTDISPAARHISQLDKTLSSMGQIVSKMKKELLEIRRTLPPFQPGDAERVRLLRGYIGLRKLIDELTVPPPVKSDKLQEGLNLPVLGDTATDKEIDDAIKVIDKTGQTLKEKQGSIGTLLGL